jgi:hypothetical protein
MDDNCEMRITPKFYESLRERGATEFEVVAFGYLDPAGQVVAMMLIKEGVPVSEVLNTFSERQRELDERQRELDEG